MISRKKDIIKELSEKLNMDIEKVEKNVDYIISRWKDIMNDENVMEICMGDFLGIMYCNKRTLKRKELIFKGKSKRYPRSNRYKDILEHTKSKLKNIVDLPNTKLCSSQRRVYKINKIHMRSKKMEEIEKIQNDFANELNQRN